MDEKLLLARIAVLEAVLMAASNCLDHAADYIARGGATRQNDLLYARAARVHARAYARESERIVTQKEVS